MKANFPLMPNATLGLMGGGQLGRMFAHAAEKLGYRVCVLEKGSCPASEVSAEHIDAGYEDPTALEMMKRSTAAVTTEFENVPAASLSALAQDCVTAPAAHAVAIAQDRLDEKTFLEKVAGVPVAPHAAVLSVEDIDGLDESLFPGILKTTRLGYDGKGQATVRTKDEARRAFEAMGGKFCILEKRLPLKRECSVIVARSLDGKQTVTFPVCENHHINGILAQTVIPARIDEAVSDRARAYAKRIADALCYTGVLCIEFFILEDDSVVANEMAPRPHNSGHATIEACETSQFEQQVRAMTGLPLGETTLVTPAVMLNILGDVWFDESGNKRTPAWDKVLCIPGAKLHLYGKNDARRARKMGHCTVIAPTVDEALARAKQVAAVLGMPEPF